MTTTVDVNPNSVDVAVGNVQAYNGSTYAVPATGNIGHLTDSNVATFYDIGTNAGLGGGAGGGGVTLGYPSLSGIASGEIVDGVAVRNVQGSSPSGNTRLLLGSSLDPLTPSSGVYTAYRRPPGVAANTPWNSHFASLQLELVGNGSIGTQFSISNHNLRYIKYARPTNTITAPTASQVFTTTTRPTITWTFSGDTLSQYAFQVKVFTAAQYGIGGFDPLVSPHTFDSGTVVSSSTTYRIPTPLANSTTYRVYVRTAQLTPTSAYIHWSTDSTTWTGQVQFSTALGNPPVPTNILPAAASTVNTDRPTLGATLPASTTEGASLIAKWELATDAGFTLNVKQVYMSGVGAVVSGPVLWTINTPLAELFQGVWYIRARSIDIGNSPSETIQSAFSTGQSFTVSHPPTTGGHTPTANKNVPFGGSGTTTFAWTFSDTSATDTQSAYQMVVERVSDGFVVFDSGKQTSTNQFHTTNISGTYKNVPLRWKVRVYDSDDVVGNYSTTQLFTIRDAPAVTVTAPLNPVDTPTKPVEWSFTPSNGFAQASWRVDIFENSISVDNLVHSASGNGAQTSYDFTGLFAYEVGGTYVAQVTVTDTTGLAATDDITTVASWTPPAKPAETVASTAYIASGYVQVDWTNAQQDGEFVSYGVYRREAGDTAWTLIAETSEIDPTYQVRDYLAPANTGLEYVVTQRATRFGSLTESAFTPVDSITPPAADYWLVHPTDSALTVRLHNVRSEDFSEEYEEETIMVVGRGRRVEYGTRLGYTGTLDAQLYDVTGQTARQQRQVIEAIKASRTHLYLRNPFGDVWTVAPGDISVSRIAGVGNREYVTLSIPYQEVY